MMNISLVVLTAGRNEYLAKTIDSLNKNVFGYIHNKIIFDNSNGPAILYSGYETIKIPDYNLPYSVERHAKVLNFIFNYLRNSDIDYVLFFEEDWELLEEINPQLLVPYLKKSVSQIRLYRKQDYQNLRPVSDSLHWCDDAKYLFSWNPSIMSAEIFKNEYPIDGQDHELTFGNMLSKPFLVYGYGREIVRHTGKKSISKNILWHDDYSVTEI